MERTSVLYAPPPPLSEEQKAALRKLREPFKPNEIGKLPRYIGDKNIPKNQRKKQNCNECHRYHEFPAVHLDYIGHAAVTARLLEVDPGWSWAPFSTDDNGQPVVERDKSGQPVGMWIWLTVLGISRPGYGSVETGKNEPMKQLVSDALRNGAMRFGVGLDLWSKEDLPSSGFDDDGPSQPVQTPISEVLVDEISMLVSQTDFDLDGQLAKKGLTSLQDLSEERGISLRDALRKLYEKQVGEEFGRGDDEPGAGY